VARLRREDPEEAVARADAALGELEHDGRSPPAAITEVWYQKLLSLSQTNRTSELRAESDRLVSRYVGFSDGEVRIVVAFALVMKAAVLKDEGRYDEAIDANNAMLAHLGEDTSPEARVEAARAYTQRAVAFAQMGRWANSLESSGDALSRLSGLTGLEASWILSEALANQARAYTEARDLRRAAASWAQLAEALSDATDSELIAAVNRSLIERARLLAELNEIDEAIVLCDALLVRLSNQADATREAVVRILQVKAPLLAAEGRYGEAVQTMDEIFVACRGSEDWLEEAATTFVAKVMLLQDLGRDNEAKRALEEGIDEFSTPALRAYDHHLSTTDVGRGEENALAVASSLYMKAWVLTETGRSAQAVSALEDIVKRFSGSALEPVQAFVENACQWIGELQ
jgi:tetratricopeptide (TPR) repeat protein